MTQYNLILPISNVPDCRDCQLHKLLVKRARLLCSHSPFLSPGKVLILFMLWNEERTYNIKSFLAGI